MRAKTTRETMDTQIQYAWKMYYRFKNTSYSKKLEELNIFRDKFLKENRYIYATSHMSWATIGFLYKQALTLICSHKDSHSGLQ